MCDPYVVPLDSAPVVVLAISSSDRDSIVPSLWHFQFSTFDLAHETGRGIVDVTDVAYRCVWQHLYSLRRGRRHVTPLHLCFVQQIRCPKTPARNSSSRHDQLRHHSDRSSLSKQRLKSNALSFSSTI